MKLLFPTLILAALVCGASCATQDYRDVSVFRSDLLELFVATGVHVETTENKKGEGVVVDALRLIMWGNSLQYVHFAGGAWANNGNNVTSAAGATFDFFINFAELIEYTESNNQEGFQIGEDVVESSYAPSLFSISTSQTNQTFSNGTSATVYNVTFTSFLDVFSYWVAYSGHPSEIQGAQLDQNTLKLGFNINYFNYLFSTRVPGTKIALVLVIAGAESAGHSFNNPKGSNQPSFTLSNGGYTGVTSFETGASYTVQGVTSQGAVHIDWKDGYTGTGATAGYKAAAVILSYDAVRPDHIYYDPTVGAQMPNAALHFGAGLVSVLLAALLAML